ncbi:MAG: hypothetical protein AB3N33_09530 [Puniceicoccaceae bacterium]
MFLTEEGCLLRKTDSGENHTLLVFFLRESGLRYVLARRRSKQPAGNALPDLFETGEVYLQQKDAAKPAFLREYTPLSRFPGIARQYTAFAAAAQLTRFYEKNLIHMEHFNGSWDLLQKALESFAAQPQPHVTLFKALYLFAKLEGYPVNAQWLQQKEPALRKALQGVLQQPVNEVSMEPKLLQESLTDLFNYFQRETDLLPPA